MNVEGPAEKNEGITAKLQKPFVTTDEILRLAENLHLKLKALYDGQRSFLDEADTDMLLDYIHRKEERFYQSVSRYREQAPNEILKASFQFTPAERRLFEEVDSWCPSSGMSIEAVLASALKFDSFMQTIYQRASEMAHNESVREVFDNLADAVCEKQKSQVQNAAWWTDI